MSSTKRTSETVACEQNIASALKSSPVIRLMLTALDRVGCSITPNRHFACESCFGGDNVLGAYDRTQNQIVICSNRCTDHSQVQRILFHELIHMYDFCLAKVDFTDLSHLACTEVRAANLAHCSSLRDAVAYPDRKDCVRSRAKNSVLAMASSVDKDVAKKAVDKVFEKCYADLEPVGRTPHEGWKCERLALSEFWHFSDQLLPRRSPKS